ncbi:MAG: carbohydrate-binding domain-containing protein, partial [Oscillospiraceae bacterium]
MEKRFLAIVLTMSLLLSVMPTAAFAEDEQQPIVTTSGDCTHHKHDDKCGYKEATAEVPCDKDCTDTDGDGTIDHADCAYCEEIPEAPCTFDETTCETCNPKDNTGEPNTSEPKANTELTAEENAPIAMAETLDEAVEVGDFTVATKVEGGYSFADNVLTISKNGNYTIGMKSGVDTTIQRIVVTATGEVNLTLNGVNIETNESQTALTLEGSTIITIPKDTTSNLTGGDGAIGYKGGNGITCSGEILIIDGAGTLSVTGGVGGGGIGGSSDPNGKEGGSGLQFG